MNAILTSEPADIVFRGGFVYSPGWGSPRPLAVAVSGGRIVFVGPETDLKPFVGLRTETIDMHGKLLLPGFHDAHLHPLIGALDMLECALQGVQGVDAYLENVREYAVKHSDKPFIRGSGWLYNAFPPSGPTKQLLDAVVPDRPVFIKAIDGHSAWVNSKALMIAGITRDTPNPTGGLIERDATTGEPSGTLREWSAMGLVSGLMAKPGPAEQLEGARLFLEKAASFGITAFHEAMGKPPFLKAWSTLWERGKLTARVCASLFCDPDRGPEQIIDLLDVRARYDRSLLRIHTGKLFLDGVIEGKTAWVRQAYEGEPRNFGEPIWDAVNFRRVVSALDRVGLQAHIHAVGDAAVKLALDGLEQARSENGPRDSSHQIAHADMVSRDDLPRFARLGVVANIQPSWFYMDGNFTKSVLGPLGPERAHALYPMRSFLQSGASVACSSDWPFGGDVITFNPLDTIRTGVTRRGIGRGIDETYVPNECVTLAQMIDAHTRGAAFADFRDSQTGSVESGKRADLILLDRNLFEMHPLEIHTAKVLLTLFDGLPIWRAPGF
ncbi:MAG: amidohydrolase [Candidatus Riflebacteria bacterium]|nr:amidohydrolase [Candidatus Riflebacteria bacterium]